MVGYAHSAQSQNASMLKYPYNIKICRRHLYGLTQAEYCNSNVLAYKRLAALVANNHGKGWLAFDEVSPCGSQLRTIFEVI